jgi:hypothetical protein
LKKKPWRCRGFFLSALKEEIDCVRHFIPRHSVIAVELFELHGIILFFERGDNLAARHVDRKNLILRSVPDENSGLACLYSRFDKTW